ncbi:hypothetical protein [Aeromonas phage AerS_266]|nr:hypothetical protein [Aeromonas phage AerS_266]
MTRTQALAIYKHLINALTRMKEKNDETGMTCGTINYPSLDFHAVIMFMLKNSWDVSLKISVNTEEGETVIKEASALITELPCKAVHEVAAKIMVDWGFDFDLSKEISINGVLQIGDLFETLYREVMIKNEPSAFWSGRLPMKVGEIEIYAGMKRPHPDPIHGFTMKLGVMELPDTEVSTGISGQNVIIPNSRREIIALLIERFEAKISK